MSSSTEIGVIDQAFPTISLVPKAETGVLSFLQKYPEYNGRDVIIAIFDSGVCPKAAGLQSTVDGFAKVIERYDCSGCGDVDCSKKVTASPEGTIIGVTGRKLKISEHMKNRNKNANEYRVGAKAFDDMYPTSVRDKVQSKYKSELWDPLHKTAVAETLRELHKLESNNTDAQKELSYKLKKDNLDQSLECLTFYDKKFMEIRTTYDCVLYQTEDGWEVVIDTTEKGELEKGVVLREYSKTYDLENVNEYMSMSMNVHDDGNILELVGLCTSHGTHVASIASGNHLNPDLNGVAPNAKIVSLTIGDGRLGSMETGVGVVRAITKVMELCNNGVKIDVINMSYGEFSHFSHCGRIGELMSEVVNKYGVVWCASAGNHGPALCTIGTPPDLCQPMCLGVGAYVSPQMMEADHALREKLPANVYTWTSRDPCIDGGQGVTICAPGAAITSVPEYTMTKAQLMNGTSMAAPHVAGCVALLISGLKQKKIKYSPYSIKRALCATATKLSHVDQFAQGSGLVNIEKAFEHLVQYQSAQENLVRFNLVCGIKSKGIHFRRGAERKIHETFVTVDPILLNDKVAPPEDKISFNLRITLVPTETWVRCPSFLDLCYSTRRFEVEINPTDLTPGVHTAKIRAYDSNCIEKGILFEVPITIVQPYIINLEKSRVFINPDCNGVKDFRPNTIVRDFVLVPDKATYAVLKMITVNTRDQQNDKFYIHTMQILQQKFCKQLETQKMFNIRSDAPTYHAFKVQQNNILEVCIAKYWSNFGETQLKYSLEFHGVSIVSPNANVMLAANGIHRIDTIALTTEEIQPSLQFKTATQILKPIETKITPLSAKRDVIPPGRQIYQNLLTYNLHVSKAQEIALYSPILSHVLYESEFESQLWMLFDVNKMLVANGDAYSHSQYYKLEKGDYTIRLQVRHEKKELLEKIQEINMLATYKLPSSFSMDFYDNYNQAMINGKKASNVFTLRNTVPKTYYFAPLLTERLQKAILPSPCAWLNGTLTLVKDELGRKVDTQSFKYILPDGMPTTTNNKKSNGSGSNNTTGNNNTSNVTTPGSPTDKNGKDGVGSPASGDASSGNSDSNSSESPKKEKTKADEYKDTLRDFMCSQMTKFGSEQAKEIYEQVVKNDPKYLPVHNQYMQMLETTVEQKSNLPITFHKSIQNLLKDNKNTSTITTDGGEDKTEVTEIQKLIEHCKKMIELANKVITETDANSLLVYYGMKQDVRTDAAKIKTNMDKQKASLLDALVKKGIYLCKQMVLEKTPTTLLDIDSPITTIFTQEQLESIKNIYIEISKFIDPNDTKVSNFAIWYSYINLYFGQMLKLVHKLYEDKLNREFLEEVSSVAQNRKWAHIVELVDKIIITTHPADYRLF